MDPKLTCEFSDNVFTIVFGVLLTLGTSASYLPQQIKILRHRSSRGLSPLYLFLASIFSSGNLLSIILLQYDSFACCRAPNINIWECNANLLDIYQIAVMPINVVFIFVISIIFADPIPAPEDHPNPEKFVKRQISFLYAMGVIYLAVISYEIYVAVLMLINWGPDSYAIVSYARVITFVVVGTTLFQYVPQIYTTFKYKGAGAVSVGTLCIQVPGNLFVVFFQLLSGSSLATWLPFLSTFIQQSILLLEIAFFECFWKKRQQAEYKVINF